MTTMNHRVQPEWSRRQVLALSAGALAAGAAPGAKGQEKTAPANAAGPFGYCLNTSTISGQNLGIVAEVDLVAKAGFNAIEPWARELEEYEAKGGNLTDLRKRLADHALAVPDAIAFAPWIVDDEAQRKAGLEQARRDMDRAARIGAAHLAAPPVGAQDRPGPTLDVIAERYHALLDLGQQMGVTPVLELWGFSKTLSRLGEVAYVAIEARHPKSCILLDIYHLYKGGADFDALRLLNGQALPLVHTNDYPAQPPRETITDAHRILPGDGVAPLGQILRTLRDINFRGYLSVELFNRSYWKQSPVKVAEAALRKTRDAVRAAFQAGATP